MDNVYAIAAKLEDWSNTHFKNSKHCIKLLQGQKRLNWCVLHFCHPAMLRSKESCFLLVCAKGWDVRMCISNSSKKNESVHTESNAPCMSNCAIYTCMLFRCLRWCNTGSCILKAAVIEPKSFWKPCCRRLKVSWRGSFWRRLTSKR